MSPAILFYRGCWGLEWGGSSPRVPASRRQAGNWTTDFWLSSKYLTQCIIMNIGYKQHPPTNPPHLTSHPSSHPPSIIHPQIHWLLHLPTHILHPIHDPSVIHPSTYPSIQRSFIHPFIILSTIQLPTHLSTHFSTQQPPHPSTLGENDCGVHKQQCLP